MSEQSQFIIYTIQGDGLNHYLCEIIGGLGNTKWSYDKSDAIRFPYVVALQIADEYSPFKLKVKVA